VSNPTYIGILLTAAAPPLPALLAYNNVVNLNHSFIANITARWESCGYADFFNTYTTSFPPTGLLPTAPSSQAPGCDIYGEIYHAAYYVVERTRA
jgi:carboxypeptidase D